MADSTQQVLAGVYTRLRRPSQVKLPYLDVLEQLNDVLRGYTQDMTLASRELRTQVAEVQLEAADIDYLLRLPNVPDFEPTMLEISPDYATVGDERAWYEVQIVPFDSWAQYYRSQRPTACFYGSYDVPEGIKVKLNLSRERISTSRWQVSYRLPLLTIVQLGERPPLPQQFLPMLKVEVALACFPLVRDHTEEWRQWMSDTIPVYTAQLADWRRRWEEYLRETVEPAVVDRTPFNQHRMVSTRHSTRGYLPINAGGQ